MLRRTTDANMADTAEDDEDLLARAIALSLSPQTQEEDRSGVLTGSTGVRCAPVGEEHVNTDRRRALIAQRKVPWCGPNEELLVMLCSMGISRNAAVKVGHYFEVFVPVYFFLDLSFYLVL